MSIDEWLLRLVELIKEDKELRAATLKLIDARAEAEIELAMWRRRRK